MRSSILLFAAGTALFPDIAEAYLCTAVPDSNPTLSQAWHDSNRCLPYYIGNSGTLLAGEARRLLVAQSFAVWSDPNCTDISFEDFGYTDQEPGFDPRRDDNKNLIISIEDEERARKEFTRGELAITITAFNKATGEIFDADILINNATFPFDDVADVDACKAMRPMPYDLRNTLIHEIGHFIGFEHDQDPDSTMFASAPECEIGKRDLTQDNVFGVCQVYPSLQPTMTCAPPLTYDGSGDVRPFRAQCDQALVKSGCECASSTRGVDAVWWVFGLLPLLMVRRVSGR